MYSQGYFTYICMCAWFSYATKFRTFSQKYEIYEIKSCTVIAENFVRDLISYISYLWLKVRNLVAYESYARIPVYVTSPSLYEDL